MLFRTIVLVLSLTTASANAFYDKRTVISSEATIYDADNRSLIALTGNSFYPIRFNATEDYSETFAVKLSNEDTRAKRINLPGKDELGRPLTFRLWPGQTANVFRSGSELRVERVRRWTAPSQIFHLYSDYENGSNSNDCLAPGREACKTANGALYIACDEMDFRGTDGNQSWLRLKLAPNQTDAFGIHFSCPLVGAQGGAVVTIEGTGKSKICPPIVDAIGVFVNAIVRIENLELCSGAAAALTVGLGARAYLLEGVTFGKAADAHLAASDPGSQIMIHSGYTITGGAQHHFLSQNGASIQTIGKIPVKFGADTEFKTFAVAGQAGFMLVPNMTFDLQEHKVKGQSAMSVNLSVIYTGKNGDKGYFPGDGVVSKSGGGQYE